MASHHRVSFGAMRVTGGLGFCALMICAVPVGATPPVPAGLSFTEEALARGVVYDVAAFSIGQEYLTDGAGRGILLSDLDGDHDPDLIVIGAATGAVGVYENDGTGVFIDRSIGSGMPTLMNASGISCGDYDGDGDLDIYFANWDAPNKLVRNEGKFEFTDVTATAGVGDPGEAAGVAWGDYDGDGWLDIYVGNKGTNRLFRNLGNGQFEEVGAALGVATLGLTWDAVFFDFDRDGDADLYVSNDKGYHPSMENHNYLFENINGSFVDITTASGTAAFIASMGVAIDDVNGDAVPDIYCTNIWLGNVMFVSQPGGSSWVDQAAALGVASYAVGWGAAFFEADNDTYPDLYVCNQNDYNRLYQFGPTPPMADMMPGDMVAGGHSISYCTATADIDMDGDVDYIVQSTGERIAMYINGLDSTNGWIRLRIVGQGSNLFAVGARAGVSVGGNWQHREVRASGAYKSQSEMILHFGTGAAQAVDAVEVTWPGGDTRTLTGLSLGQVWPIYPPERLGDVDLNGVVNLDDVGDFASVLLGIEGDIDRLAVADMNGDGRADGRDVGPFVEVLVD